MKYFYALAVFVSVSFLELEAQNVDTLSTDRKVVLSEAVITGVREPSDTKHLSQTVSVSIGRK